MKIQAKNNQVRPREREAIVKSLRVGVTPNIGLQHIQVGRLNEVKTLLNDLDHICDGGAALRFVIGDFGSGKSFFLKLVRSIALEKGMVTVHADLSPERRLYSTSGHARSLYAELMRNFSTRSKPEGGAIQAVVERMIFLAKKAADNSNKTVTEVIEDQLHHLTEFVGGYDFAKVIELYWRAFEDGDTSLKAATIQWLRGEFNTKTDVRKSLNIRSIIDDANVYDQLKLLSLFVRQAGYNGFWISLDEMVNLYKLANQQSRLSNYEQLLRILNDCLQGNNRNIGFIFGGTPDFLLDSRKGLYSYGALRSRLEENAFAIQAEVVDYSSPTLHLNNLSPEDLLVLLRNLRHLYAFGDESKYLLPDSALTAFLHHCSDKIGNAYFQTPRNTIKAFLDLLTVLEQYPDKDWKSLIGGVDIDKEVNTDMPKITLGSSDIPDDNTELSTFKL